MLRQTEHVQLQLCGACWLSVTTPRYKLAALKLCWCKAKKRAVAMYTAALAALSQATNVCSSRLFSEQPQSVT